MPNRWLPNGSSYQTSATLGNLLSSTVRVVCKNASWDTIGSGGYLFSQAGSTAGNREFGLFSLDGDLSFFAGGTENAKVFSQEQIASHFGSSVMTGTIDFELNYSTGVWFLKADDVLLIQGTATVGAGRTDGQLFRIGGRNSADDTGTGGAFIIVNGAKVGDTEVFINDTLTRSYAMPTTGSTITESEASANGTLQAGTGGSSDWETLTTDVVAPIIPPITAIDSSQTTSVTFSGEFSGAPDSIEYRVMDGVAEVQTWMDVDAFSNSIYTVSTPFSTAVGSGFTVEIRTVVSATPGATRTSSAFDAGIVIGFVGSSSAERVFSLSSGTTNGRVHTSSDGVWDLKAAALMTGASAVVLANDIFDNVIPGSPVGFYDYGVGGTGFAAWDQGEAAYDALIGAVKNKNISCITSQLGYNDANAGTTVTNAQYQDFVDNIRADLITASLPFLVIGTQRDANGAQQDAEFVALWTSEKTVSDGTANTFNSWRHDLEISVDSIHLTQTAQNTAALRWSNWAEFIFASGTYYRGPQITNIAPDGTTVDVLLGGLNTSFSDFTPTTAIAGFQVNDDGTPLTISAAVRLDATTIRLTTTTTPAGEVTVDFAGYNANVPAGLAFANYPAGNDVLALPMEPIFTSFSVIPPITAGITRPLTRTLLSNLTRQV